MNKIIRTHIEEVVGHKEWGLDDDFIRDIKLNQDEHYRLIMDVDTSFGFRTKEIYFEDIHTPNDLIKHIEAYKQPIERKKGWYKKAKVIYLKRNATK